MLSVSVGCGWLLPVACLEVMHQLATPVDPYLPTLLIAAVFGLPLLIVTCCVRSIGLHFVSGVMFGVVLLSPWIPFSERHLFFVRACTVRKGMTIEQVRLRMEGYPETELECESGHQQVLYYTWNHDGSSDMDQLRVTIGKGRAVGTFIGSE